MDGLLLPILKRAQHLLRFFQRDFGFFQIGLHLFMAIHRQIVIRQRAQKRDLVRDLGKGFQPLLQNLAQHLLLAVVGGQHLVVIRGGVRGKRGLIHMADVLGIHPAQLVFIENRRRFGNALDIKRLGQLFHGKQFLVGAGVPAQKRDVV